jgi:hypothetical protein
VLHVIQDFLLLVCRKCPDGIENRLFQSHRKARLSILSVVFGIQKRGYRPSGSRLYVVVDALVCSGEEGRDRFVKILGMQDCAG